MPPKVFLTVSDDTGFHAVLVANHVRPIQIPAGMNMHYALHGPQGVRLSWPVSVKRVGNDLHVFVRDDDHQPEADFIISAFFSQRGDGQAPVLTDHWGVPYVDATHRLSDYERNLQPGQSVDLVLGTETEARAAALGGSLVGTAATWVDTVSASVTGVGANIGDLSTILVSAFSDTDRDGNLNIEGRAIANSTIQVLAPDGVTVFTVTVDAQGHFAVDVDVSALSPLLGTYELSYLGEQAAMPGVQMVLTSLDGVVDNTTAPSPELAQLQLSLAGAAADGSEVLWLGDARVPWDGSVSSGQSHVGDVTWSWQWVDGQLIFSTSTDASGAQVWDVASLLGAAHWESNALADVAGTRLLDVSRVDVDGQQYAWSSTLLWGTPALALDLNGDGRIDYTQVLRDINGDGIMDRQGGVAAADGLLVTNWSAIALGAQGYSTDFTGATGQTTVESLRAYYDENADGVFDGQDTWFADLSVWQDLDQNGVVAAEELHSLSALGIDALSLAATLSSAQPEALVHVGAQGLANSADGLQTWLWQDVALAQAWGVI